MVDRILKKTVFIQKLNSFFVCFLLHFPRGDFIHYLLRFKKPISCAARIVTDWHHTTGVSPLLPAGPGKPSLGPVHSMMEQWKNSLWILILSLPGTARPGQSSVCQQSSWYSPTVLLSILTPEQCIAPICQ